MLFLLTFAVSVQLQIEMCSLILKSLLIIVLVASSLSFRWKYVSPSRQTARYAHYDVKVIADGEESIVNISSDNTLLNELDKAGFSPPSSCRTGLCTECAALVTANFESIQLDAAVLDPETTEKGFILTCAARVAGPGLEIVLDQHSEMYESQYGDFRRDHEKNQENIPKSGGLLGGLQSALNLNTEA